MEKVAGLEERWRMWQARGKMTEDVAGLEDDGRCGRLEER